MQRVWSEWTYLDVVPAGRRERLYPYAFRKDDGPVVYLLNASEFEHVGEYDWVAFGPDRSAVEEFVEHLCVLDGCELLEIRAEDTVNQTS